MSAYSEDALVEKFAVDVFTKELKIDHLNCYEEKFPQTLGRETKSEVVLVKRLQEAIKKMNKGLSEDAVKDAISQLIQDRSRLSLVRANKEVYKLLKDGVKVKSKNATGVYEHKTVRVIDFDHPENNDFFLATQFWVTGEMYTRRPDAVLFVNGLPLVLLEFKARHEDVKKAFDDNITDYKDAIPQIFWYNAFIVLSNAEESKIGSVTSGYEHFSDWKKISSEDERGKISLDTLLKGTCERNRFIDLFENFILHTTIEGNDVKIVAKNHQYLGVNNAVESFKERKRKKGRLGVFWHTQGAGKSYSMIFFAQKVLRKFEGNYTFVIVTDRMELDDQIYQNFQQAGVVTEEQVQAESGEHLKRLLKEDHRMIFTLIHKFNTKKGEKFPQLSDRDDVIVITDEAHRTQYDILALNMRNALPNASFMGFTGTPLIAGEEEKTQEVFGKYVSIYNFRDSIEDKATVPLFYENRVPELQIINPVLNDHIYDVIEKAELSEEEEDKLSKELSKDYHIITRDDRLETVAEDIANHFVARGYSGKAMVVSIDKLTAVKMYEKVSRHLQNLLKEKEKQASKKGSSPTMEGRKKIEWLKNLDLAVVVSQEQNEVSKFKKAGYDVSKHRKRMVTEDLATKFKDPKSKLQIVFVCNMWITGFDVPSLSTIYLDRPMRNHTLMQTIARANRVFKEKTAGFIVDYINVFRNLRKALAIYASGPSESKVDLPIQSKDILVENLRTKLTEMNVFLKSLDINANEIIQADRVSKNMLLSDARSALVENDETKKTFLEKAGLTSKIFNNILPHKSANEFISQIALYQQLVKEIRMLDPEVDISSVIVDIQGVLDKSVARKGYVFEDSDEKQRIDLRQIDFDALKKRFEKNKDNADIERLKNILNYKLREMIRINSSRIDYLEKFQELVDEYNAGSLNQETFFNELIYLSKNLSVEEKRAVTEGLTEEELALFDKLLKPKLTNKEVSAIKKVAKELLQKMKTSKLVLDWRKKQQTRAAVRLEIERKLEEMVPDIYAEKDYAQKCNSVFQHFYDNYFGDGLSIFSKA